MVTASDVIDLLNSRIGRILDMAELTLPKEKFDVFRRMTLREFGNDGFARDLDEILRRDAGQERNGPGRSHTSMKGGAP